ncbi:DUF5694 domain-containing protein [Dokdonella sp.]|uniref:DUF5694 domain-containing protein n=1 Tax=Dokdonella sp. TaxID=2291710 RepID=UPI003784CFCA
MKTWVASAALAALTIGGPAQAGVDLSALDKHMSGPRSQVLVLGSVHLSQMKETVKPESLEPLLARLAAFKPDIITIENLSGEGCDLLARHPAIYPPQDVSPYCRDTAAAKAATGLDVPAAIAAAAKLLADWPGQPSAAQRRHLAALFLAANDASSAVVQWLQLPQAEQRTGDGLDDALVAELRKRATGSNESDQVAARLAARLGLQRVYPIDDHTGDSIVIADENAYGEAIQAAWSSGRAKAAPMREHVEALKKGGDMLALYRYINQPDVMQLAIESDFGAALRDPSPQHYGRHYVAGWETRNLRMVSNIRAAFRQRPGARVLVVVGSSHKPWFDSLLGQMQGVEIVDVQKALREK